MNIKYSYLTEEDAYGIEYVAAHSWKETYMGLLPDEYLDNKNIKNMVIWEQFMYLKNIMGMEQEKSYLKQQLMN